MKIGISKFENIGCLVPAQKGVAAPMKPAMPIAKQVNQFLSFQKYYNAEICTIGPTLMKIENGILKSENIGHLVPIQKGMAAL